MKHPLTPGRALAVGAAAVLLLTACGSSDDDAPAGSDLSYEDTPLTEYMGSVWQSEPDTRAETDAHEAVAQCMADEGFDYTVPEAAPPGPFEAGFDMDQMDTESWVAANGYGMSSVWEPEEEQVSDANGEYVASLSDSSRKEYYAALYGTYSEGMTDEELASYVPTDAEQGCWGRGEVEGFTPEYVDDPEFLEYVEAVEKMQSTVAEDPAVGAADETWADCMADAGFAGYATPTDPIDELSMEYSELYFPTDPTAGAQPDDQTVADLREREISTALADRTCKDETGYDEAYLEVVYTVEQQFIDDNTAWLDEIIAANES